MLQIVNPKCQSFFDHWRALPRRDGKRVPHTHDFFDHAPARFMAGAYIHEVLHDGLIVRFMGSELVERWRRDETGQMFGAHLPAATRQRMLTVAQIITQHPCGLLQHGTLSTSAGREASFEGLLLPLEADAPAPPRVVVFSAILDKLERQEYGSNFFSAGERRWLDLGHGVPDLPPPPQA